MPSNFQAKQLNDVKPTDLAAALMSLSTEGFTDWQIYVQEDMVVKGPFEGKPGWHLETNRVLKYSVLAWGVFDEEEQ